MIIRLTDIKEGVYLKYNILNRFIKVIPELSEWNRFDISNNIKKAWPSEFRNQQIDGVDITKMYFVRNTLLLEFDRVIYSDDGEIDDCFSEYACEFLKDIQRVKTGLKMINPHIVNFIKDTIEYYSVDSNSLLDINANNIYHKEKEGSKNQPFNYQEYI